MKKNLLLTKALPILLLTVISTLSAKAGLYPFSATYSGAQEVPPNASTATGTINGVYNDFTNIIHYTINFSGLSANTIAAHFHGPAAPGVGAGVTLAHAGFPTGVTSGIYTKTDTLTDAQEADLLAGLWYSNIHTTTLPGGEIRAQIILGPPSTSFFIFSNPYSGAQEVPPNASPGTGTINGAYDSSANLIYYTISFSGLTDTTIAAHFHGPAMPGVAAGVTIPHAGFPIGDTAGVFNKMDTLTNVQEADLLAGLWYSNIHTDSFPGGEIRAQIELQQPPSITCPADTTLDNDPGLCSASLAFSATATGTPAPTIEYSINGTIITSPYDFPVDTTTVTAVATNSAGTDTCTFTVIVLDVEPPVISDLEASPGTLWPPNHKMRNVNVHYTSTDNCPGVITCTIGVTSDEPVLGGGSGNTSPDWLVLDDHLVKLRAERAGSGDGRTYTLSVTCTDEHGNSSTSSTTVEVPHDMGNNDRWTGADAIEMADGFTLSVLTNPSHNYFTLRIETNNSEKIALKMVDLAGRIVESKSNLTGNQTLRIGDKLKAGVYFIEVTQGGERKQLKLMKLN